jgi:diadenosine tetraphosphate (Ap4A) HIT family hydrolase
VLREQLAPTKINLAALGNMVAHLHWHVIARYDWDSHFPASVWLRPSASAMKSAKPRLRQLPQVDGVLQRALALWAA